MSELKKPYLVLHFCVLLWGFTAILGDIIDLNGLILVWWRVLFTCISLIIVIKWYAINFKNVPTDMILKLAGIGLFVMLHWVCFYGSIKEGGNPSVTLSCLATTTFFTALIEPFVIKRSVRWYEIALGVFIIPGMYLIFYFVGNQYFWAIVYGLLSAFFAAVFSSLNKAVVDKVDPISMTFIELAGGFLGLCLVLPFFSQGQIFLPSMSDTFYLLILAVICTTLPFILSLRALRHISAFNSNRIINLEPVYGVFLSWTLLGKGRELNIGFYIGIAIILTAVFVYPTIHRHFTKDSL